MAAGLATAAMGSAAVQAAPREPRATVASPALAALGRAIRARHPDLYAALGRELAGCASAYAGIPCLSLSGWRLDRADLCACVAALEQQTVDVD